jgi:HEAT repeat protein
MYDEATWARAQAIRALENLGCIDQLLELAHDKTLETQVFVKVAEVLELSGHVDEAAQAWVDVGCREEADDKEREQATEALGRLGRMNEAAQVWLALARDEMAPEWTRSRAVDELGDLQQTEELIGLARDAILEHGMRVCAAKRLAVSEWIPEAQEATKILLSFLSDTGVAEDVRVATACALGELAQARQDSGWRDEVAALLLELDDDLALSPAHRVQVAESLGHLGKSGEAVTILAEIGSETALEPEMRAEAANALGRLGHKDAAANILVGLGSEASVEPAIRAEIASALGQLGCNDDATDILLRLARDENRDSYEGWQEQRRRRVLAAGGLAELGRLEDLVMLLREGSISLNTCQEAFDTGRSREWPISTSTFVTLIRDSQLERWLRSWAVHELGDRRLVNELLELARDNSLELRGEAVQTLANLGRADELLTLAKEMKVAGDCLWAARVRLVVANTLVWAGRSEVAAPILFQIIEDSSLEAEIRLTAAIIVGDLGWVEEASSHLVLMAQRDTVEASELKRAAEALQEWGRTNEAAQVWFAVVQDRTRYDRYGARGAALQALGELGQFDILLSLASDDTLDTEARTEAARKLGEFGPIEDTVKAWHALVSDGKVNGYWRVKAARELDELGRPSDAVKAWRTLAFDREAEGHSRAEATRALNRLGQTDDAVQAWRALASDCEVDGHWRVEAAVALSELGKTDEALSTLRRIVSDEEHGARGEAARVLARLGCADEVVPVLRTLAYDSAVDDAVRAAAAETLAELGMASHATAVLVALARDPQVIVRVRKRAVSGLGEMGQTEYLLALVRDEEVHDDVQETAVEALGGMGQSETLLALVRDREVDDSLREHVVEVLSQQRCIEELLALARDCEMDDWIRGQAADAVGNSGQQTEEAVFILLALASDRTVNDWVRRQAAEVVGELGQAAAMPKVLERLQALAENEDAPREVQRAAQQALWRIESEHK